MGTNHKLQEVLDGIAAAENAAGRSAGATQLIAVSKTFSGDQIEPVLQAGHRVFGENRVQELKLKASALPGIHQGGDVTWHMIGHVQRNKAKDVIEHADMIHAVDSLRLAQELDRRAGEASRVLPCLVQVNVSGESSKFGLEPADVADFMEALSPLQHLSVSGFMTLASPAQDPETIRPQFRLLRSLMEDVKASNAGFASMTCLSMGMSGDFEVAIEEGATHVRVGSALFGART